MDGHSDGYLENSDSIWKPSETLGRICLPYTANNKSEQQMTGLSYKVLKWLMKQ